MSTMEHLDRLIDLRRDLHRHPEPAWREFYTTARLLEEVERIGVDELYVGADALDVESRWAVPDEPGEIEEWVERAISSGADAGCVRELADGTTGLVAVLDRGEGPHIGLRVDIDALVREESTASEHTPVAEGFRSRNPGMMHACAHDGHATIGVGVLEQIARSDFSGRLTVCFQPAEEEAGGGRALANSGHLDDVDYFLAIHLGLGYGTGEVVAGFDDFLAVSNLTGSFHGTGAHAGSRPETGQNALLALSTAIQNLYSISRHSEGGTRVNVGTVSAGSASNIIPEEASLVGEVRGSTTALREYMKTRASQVLEGAAAMHDCRVEFEFGPEAPSAVSDDSLAAAVRAVAEEVSGVDTIHEKATFSGSEDATYVMEHVQERGGLAAYVGVGTDHPGGHHTATFDIDEESIRIGVDLLTATIQRVATAGVD